MKGCAQSMSIELFQLIIDTLSAILTCIAFIVAWMTYQKEYAVKISINVTDHPVLTGSIKQNRLDYAFSVTIKNTSNRPILVENIGLRVATYGISVMSNVMDAKLEAADIIRTGVQIPTIESMKTIWPTKKKDASKKKVYIVVTSSIGKHVIKTKSTLRELINLRHQHSAPTTLCENMDDYKSIHASSVNGDNDSVV